MCLSLWCLACHCPKTAVEPVESFSVRYFFLFCQNYFFLFMWSFVFVVLFEVWDETWDVSLYFHFLVFLCICCHDNIIGQSESCLCTTPECFALFVMQKTFVRGTARCQWKNFLISCIWCRSSVLLEFNFRWCAVIQEEKSIRHAETCQTFKNGDSHSSRKADT